MRGAAWVFAAIVVAAALSYATAAGSALNSCGVGNDGPNPGAEEEYCGYGSGEPSDYSTLFVVMQLIPAIPVVLGGVLPALGRSRLFFPLGVGFGMAATALIWLLGP